MAEVTVKQLAEVVGIPVDRLLKQMQEAGLDHGNSDQVVSDDEKQRLLSHLKQSSNTERADRKITLKRRSLSTLKVAGTHGKSKTVNVEVRKKRTYVKRSVVMEEQADQERQQQEEQAVIDAAAAEAENQLQQAESLPGDSAISQALSGDQVSVEGHSSDKPAADEASVAEAEARKSKKPLPAVASKSKGVRSGLVDGSVEESQKLLAEHALESQAELEKKKHDQERARKQAEQLRKEADEKARQKTLEDAKRFAEELEKRGGAGQPAEAAVAEVEEEDALVRQAFEESIAAEEKRTKRSRRPSIRHKAKIAKKLSEEHGFTQPTAPVIKEVRISETIRVADLANQMSVKGNQVVRQLMQMGVMSTVNQSVDQDTAVLVVEELGHLPVLVNENAVEDDLVQSISDSIERGDSIARAPVVTIMGHVDHGKTSLLDYIRSTKITDVEAGGITQHIGAYHVQSKNSNITFLDTPGHAAFTAMRARGAQCTDVVIVVVAADDGLMPQTEEAIDHARAAGVPIVVAVNKIDKEQADPEKVRNELASRKELIPEEWGGDIPYVNVSAHSGEGIDDLLEAVSLQAEILELSAPAIGPAEGVVVESRLDKGRGAIATLLVQKGQLNVGDMVLAGAHFGRVRAMRDDANRSEASVGPSMPVEILGLGGVPDAGDIFLVVADERKAKEVAARRAHRDKQTRFSRVQGQRVENLFSAPGAIVTECVNVFLKTDVRGSLEALNGALSELGNEEVAVNIVGSGVGAITESDINLAITTQSLVVGFNVRADVAAKRLAQEESVDIRYYSVIYDIINDVKDALSGLLKPEVREKILGVAQVRDVFRSSKFGAAAGCMVLEGSLFRNKRIRILRDDIVVFEGELESLRRFKDDVPEVRSGTECGVAVKSYTNIRAGDKIEAYEVSEISRTL